MMVWLNMFLSACLFSAAAASHRLTWRSLEASRRWREEVARVGRSWKDGKDNPGGPWRFRGRWLGDQRGSLEIWGVVVLLALAAYLALQTWTWRSHHTTIQRHFRRALCLKESMLDQRRLVARVNRINAVLLAGETASMAGIFLPAGMVLRGSWEKTKRVLQQAQNAAWLSSRSTLARLAQAGCSGLAVREAPYRWEGRGLVRRPDGRVHLARPNGDFNWDTSLVSYALNWRVPDDVSTRMSWEVR